MDKRLVDNILKHTETSNRVLEEEQCWREIKRQYNNVKRRSPSNSSTNSGRSATNSSRSVTNSSRSIANSHNLTNEASVDAYERALRLEAKKQLELTAARVLPSAAGGQKAKEFWRGLIRQQLTLDRWGHDGWEELQSEGPLPPDTDVDKKKKSQLAVDKAAKRQMQISRVLEKQTRKLDRKRKLLSKRSKVKANGKFKPSRRPTKKRRRHRSYSSSSSSSTSSSTAPSSSSATSSQPYSSSSSSSSASSSSSGSDSESRASSIETGDEIVWQES